MRHIPHPLGTRRDVGARAPLSSPLCVSEATAFHRPSPPLSPSMRSVGGTRSAVLGARGAPKDKPLSPKIPFSSVVCAPSLVPVAGPLHDHCATASYRNPNGLPSIMCIHLARGRERAEVWASDSTEHNTILRHALAIISQTLPCVLLTLYLCQWQRQCLVFNKRLSY